jgi:hypothetical protein
MLPLSPEPMRSSTGNSIESVEQPWGEHVPEPILDLRGRWILDPSCLRSNPSNTLFLATRRDRPDFPVQVVEVGHDKILVFPASSSTS